MYSSCCMIQVKVVVASLKRKNTRDIQIENTIKFHFLNIRPSIKM